MNRDISQCIQGAACLALGNFIYQAAFAGQHWGQAVTCSIMTTLGVYVGYNRLRKK